MTIFPGKMGCTKAGVGEFCSLLDVVIYSSMWIRQGMPEMLSRIVEFSAYIKGPAGLSSSSFFNKGIIEIVLRYLYIGILF